VHDPRCTSMSCKAHYAVQFALMACKLDEVVDLYMGASVLQTLAVRSTILCKMLRIEGYTQVEASKQWDVP